MNELDSITTMQIFFREPDPASSTANLRKMTKPEFLKNEVGIGHDLSTILELPSFSAWKKRWGIQGVGLYRLYRRTPSWTVSSPGPFLLVALMLEMFLVALVLEEGVRVVLVDPLCFLEIEGGLRLDFLPLAAPWNRDGQACPRNRKGAQSRG